MKDKNGKNLKIFDFVIVAGDKNWWQIVRVQDDFGDMKLKSPFTGQELFRDPVNVKLVMKSGEGV